MDRELQWMKLRYNKKVRQIFGKAVQWKRWMGISLYRKSKDSLYIRTLKDQAKGKKCFIIGNGPSLTPDDLERIKAYDSFGANSIYKIFDRTSWRPTYYFTVDKDVNQKFLQEMRQDATTKPILKFIYGRKKRFKELENAHRIYLYGKIEPDRKQQIITTISKDVSRYFTNALSVVFEMLELALYMGYSEIYLLGVDHTFTYSIDSEGKKIYHSGAASHFQGGCYQNEEEKKLVAAANKEAMDIHFESIRGYAESRNIKIYNCTRGGILEVFPRAVLEDVL